MKVTGAKAEQTHMFILKYLILLLVDSLKIKKQN